jgi:hypothetical protein
MPYGAIMCSGVTHSNYGMITEAVSPLTLLTRKSSMSSDGYTSKESLGKGHRRRSRTNYTSDQLNAMEDMFFINQYPDFDSREELADAIDLSEARIQVCVNIFI